MALTTMYNGQVNSPQTALNGAINSSVTSITVVDGTILPTAPMPLVISEGSKEPETVLMTNKVGNVLTVTRGFQGVAQSWSDGVSIGRNFTAYDYNTLVENATTINNDLTTHKAESATQAHLAKNIGLEDTTGNFTATELEGAMSELFTNVSNGKNSIASSITGKGVSASGSDSFSVLSTKINNIVTDPSGSTTATVGDLLSGKTAYSKGVKLTGTMPNRGAYNITPGSSNKAIPSGYHSGGGVVYGDADLVSANIKAGKNIFGVAGNSNVVDTSAGTAVAADIYPGKKAYVDGSLITGTMATKSAQTFTPKTTNQTIASGSYLTGTQTIAGDADLVAGNIASGVNIFGVVGSMVNASKVIPFGAEWVLAKSAPANVYGLASNGSRWVAALTGPRIMYADTSNIGSWSTAFSSMSGTNAVNTVCWKPSIFVAGCNSGVMLSSSDGVTWTKRTTTFGTSHIRSVATNGSIFVAGGDSGIINTSSDGVTWTARSSGFPSNGRVWCTTYGNGAWVAVGNTGKISTSTDGYSWTARTSGITTDIRSVAYGNGMWIAVGSSNAVLYSTNNGASWTKLSSSVTPFGSSASLNTIEFLGNSWVIGADDGEMASSKNGLVWGSLLKPLGTTTSDIATIKSDGENALFACGVDIYYLK